MGNLPQFSYRTKCNSYSQKSLMTPVNHVFIATTQTKVRILTSLIGNRFLTFDAKDRSAQSTIYPLLSSIKFLKEWLEMLEVTDVI